MSNVVKTYEYPDGSRRTIKPTNGQICKVPSHKKGQHSRYEYDEKDESWYILPKTRTSEDVIDKAKEILKIGKYSNLRPKKRHWSDDYYDFADEFPMGGWHGTYPYGPVEKTVDVCDVTSSYKNMMRGLNDEAKEREERKARSAFETGTHYEACECGAVYTTNMKDHHRWCPRFGKGY